MTDDDRRTPVAVSPPDARPPAAPPADPAAVPAAAVTESAPVWVSVVLFAFNQERYVREAVAGILAQDYPHLQIILSDDNSSDRTFDIMREMAADYRGPHRIVLNRTAGGGGTLAHFLKAAALADGDLTLCAAGDDISLPHRVRTLVEHWRGERPAVIYSAWNRVEVDGRFLRRDGIADQHDRDFNAYFPDRAVRAAAFGCTAAYASDFLRLVPLPERVIWSEDYFLSLVAILAGDTVAYVDEPLVSYRQNPQALRNYATAKVDFQAYEERENRFFDGLAAMLVSFLELVDRGVPPAGTGVDRGAVERDIAWYRYRADWTRTHIAARLRYVAGLRSRQRLRWAVPRLPGINAFLRAKTALARWRGGP